LLSFTPEAEPDNLINLKLYMLIIAFPNINPVIISFGKLSVNYYSLSYVVSILLAWFYAKHIVQKFPFTKITKKHLEDFMNVAILAIILGGRLIYCLFYDPMKYLSNPIEILKTYEGGMAFHGGLIGLAIAIYLFSKKHQLSFLTLCDIVAMVSPIGLCLGRIANFINGELYGRVTDAKWAVIFPHSDMLPRHPSQLYESFFEGMLLLLILAYLVFKHNILRFQGLTTGLFLIFYSIFRIIIELFREPDINLGFIFGYVTMGQMLSLPMLLAGIYLTQQYKRKQYAHH
jgi:phosphatidylglycerol:prolipoprotein diacylglycerol transferase